MIGILNLSGRRRLPLIRQAEGAECGLASIAMVAAFHGHEVDLATMRLKFGLSLKGMTLKTLTDIAAAIGLGARAVRCEPDELSDLRMPAILHWGTNHFVVLKRMRGRKAVIHDPAMGACTVDADELSKHFTGVALELLPSHNFRPKRETNPLKLGSLISLSPDTMRALLQAVVLSLVIEMLVIAGPFYMQLVIDQAVMKGDTGLLALLAMCFSVVLVFRILALTFRGLTLQFVSRVLSFEMQARVFSHLLRLPLEWFHKRQVGDVQSRFHAIQPIQNFLSNGALAGALDGVLGSIVLVLMFYYSWQLAAIVLVSVGLYALLRTTTLRLQRRLAGDLIVAQANESTRFLESLRAAETIKAGSAEVVRDVQQRNAMAKTANASIRSGNVDIGYVSAEQMLTGATDILIIYVGAAAVMRGDLSIGMLTAFLAYKGQFFTRITNLVEQAISWRLLDLQLERLSDIALTPKEPRIDSGGYDGPLNGAVDCRGLTFQYAFGEAPVLAGVDLSIAPGEYVAITGPSGCGKSTLLKLLIGLYTPSLGQVFIDGRPLSQWNPRAVRRHIAVVSQDDQLLSGSIAENIGFFDEGLDFEQVRACARVARIHDDIMAMPMAYESLVGDMGSSLSGGQKQRLLIARALYRRPRILVLDEGTSHLDVENEKAINAALAVLPITRIVVAHRPETIRSAARVLRFERGRLLCDEAQRSEAAAVGGNAEA